MTANTPDVHAAGLWHQSVHDVDLPLAALARSRAEPPTALDYVSGVEPQEQDAAERMMRAVEDRLRTLRFTPVVSQLSHAGISDPDRQGFIAAIRGRGDVVKVYVDTIRGNLEGEHTPIAPSPALYWEAFWHSRAAVDSEPSADAEAAETKLVEYPLRSEGVAKDASTMTRFIGSFHRRVVGALQDQCGIPAAAMTDFIAIPFKRMRLAGHVAAAHDQEHRRDLGVQGGVCFALGRFAHTNREGMNRSLLTFREELLHKFQEAIANDSASILRQQALRVQESLLHRGTVHEIKELTRLISLLSTQQLDHVGADHPVAEAAREIQTSTKVMTAVADALTRHEHGDVSLDTAAGHAALLLLFQVRPTLHTYSVYKKFRQNTCEIETLLARAATGIDIDTVISEMRRSPALGKVVVAIRNLLDNAIQGNGSQWCDGAVVNEDDDKAFAIALDATPDSVRIYNGARLQPETYALSFTLDEFDRPRGFYIPGRGDVAREISIKGSRLAQTILESLGFVVGLERVSDGTVTVISRKGQA